MVVAGNSPIRYRGVMVSSTFTDLERHRTALIKAVHGQELTAVAMENDSAKADVDVIDSSLQMVRDASAYVCLIGKKYGQMPVSPDRNPNKVSITELEFNEALRLERPILLFIMGDEHPLREADFEINAAKRKKLSAFRSRAKQMKPGSTVHRIYATFNSLEELNSEAIQAVAGLRRYLDELDQDSGSDTNGSQAAVPAPAKHLPQRKALFIGRETEIEILRRQLQEPGALAYISGVAGRGKTALALEYAHRHKAGFESVHWIPCQDRSLVQMAGELAWQLGLKREGELDVVVRELNRHCAQKRCLLVLDNVDDDVPSRLIPGGQTSVLVTTRLTNLPFLRHHQPLQLPLFSEEQCFELFRKEIGKEEVDRHATDARGLFQRLGYLPIGISVAASLVREDVRYTIEGMAKNLPAGAYALLQEAVAALSAPAQTLLASMAVCAPEGFRLGLAAEIAEMDEAAALDALQEIHSRSLAEELDRSTRRYRLHALVREASGATDALRLKQAERVEREFQNWESDWRRCEEDMADWRVSFAWALDQARDDGAWSLACNLAQTGHSLAYRLGRLSEAYEICERMAHEAGRKDDASRLQSWYRRKALILDDWGRLEEAMALHKRQEAISIELGDRDGLQRSYGNQASILRDWGQLEEAMALHKRQEAISIELGDRDSLQKGYGNQALILWDWGQLEEAMALNKRQEAISIELGDRHSLQKSYGNQALILRAWGRLEEAMELHKQEEAICLELGSRSGLAYCYWNWGMLAREQEDSKAEREKLEHALALFTELKMSLQIKAVLEDLDETKSSG